MAWRFEKALPFSAPSHDELAFSQIVDDEVFLMGPSASDPSYGFWKCNLVSNVYTQLATPAEDMPWQWVTALVRAGGYIFCVIEHPDSPYRGLARYDIGGDSWAYSSVIPELCGYAPDIHAIAVASDSDTIYCWIHATYSYAVAKYVWSTGTWTVPTGTANFIYSHVTYPPVGELIYYVEPGVDLWKAHTFTPATTHNVTRVRLRLYRTNNPGTLTVGIRATDGDGKPTGADLTSGTLDVSGITTDTGGEWYDIDVTSYELTADVKYAIVCRISGIYPDRLYWLRKNAFAPSGGWSGAMCISGDAGTTWGSPDSLKPFCFVEWDYAGTFDVGKTSGSGIAFSAALNAGETVFFCGGGFPGYDYGKYTFSTKTYQGVDLTTPDANCDAICYSTGVIWFTQWLYDDPVEYHHVKGYVDVEDGSEHTEVFPRNEEVLRTYGLCFGVSDEDIVDFVKGTAPELMSTFPALTVSMAGLNPALIELMT